MIVCMSAAAAGTGLSWTSPVNNQLSAPDSIIKVTGDQLTWVAAFLPIGAIVGAVPSGILADKLGRKKTAMLIAIPYIISWILIVFAKNVTILFIARFLIGKSTFLEVT